MQGQIGGAVPPGPASEGIRRGPERGEREAVGGAGRAPAAVTAAGGRRRQGEEGRRRPARRLRQGRRELQTVPRGPHEEGLHS